VTVSFIERGIEKTRGKTSVILLIAAKFTIYGCVDHTTPLTENRTHKS